MTTFNQPPTAGAFIQASEIGGRLQTTWPSLGHVTMAPTTVDIEAGTVLGTISASGKWGVYSAVATDGRQTAKGVLYTRARASAADQRAAAVLRDARVTGSMLIGLDAAAVGQLRNGMSVNVGPAGGPASVIDVTLPIQIIVN